MPKTSKDYLPKQIKLGHFVIDIQLIDGTVSLNIAEQLYYQSDMKGDRTFWNKSEHQDPSRKALFFRLLPKHLKVTFASI